MTRLVKFFAGLVVCVSVASAAAINYTCDSSVDSTAAGTCSYLNSEIASLYGSSFTNLSASIYIEQGITSLAMSEPAEIFVPYSSYVSALGNNSSGNNVDTAALAALSSLDTAVYGADNVVLTSALAAALGFSGVGGLTSGGTNCALGEPGCYNGIIIVTTPANLASAHPGESLYYSQNGGHIASSQFDYYSLVERETDEILGTTSCITTTGGILTDHCDSGTGAPAGTGTPSAADLFRFVSGGLALNNASLGLSDASGAAYFSYDGGVTNGAGGALFNTATNGQSYSDFTSSCGWVQSASGCLGNSLNIDSDGRAEINMLDAVGYNTTPEPGTLLLAAAGLLAACTGRFCKRLIS